MVLYGCVTIGIGVRVFALCYTYPLSVVLYCALYCVAFMYASHSLLKPAVVQVGVGTCVRVCVVWLSWWILFLFVALPSWFFAVPLPAFSAVSSAILCPQQL